MKDATLSGKLSSYAVAVKRYLPFFEIKSFCRGSN